MAVVTEERPRFPSRTDYRGPYYCRSFSIYAESEPDAYVVLAQQKSVYRGVMYQDHNGNFGDTGAICLSIDVQTRVPAPSGGTGYYSADAHYGYPRTIYFRPAPKRDGRKVFHWERDLYSEPAEYDNLGDPIVNATDDEFAPAPVRLRLSRVLVAQWIKDFPDQETAENTYAPYEEVVNSLPYRNNPKHCLWCAGIEVNSHLEIGASSNRFEYVDGPAGPSGTMFPFHMTARFMVKRQSPEFTEMSGAGVVRYGGWDYWTKNISYNLWKMIDGKRKKVALQTPDGLPYRKPAPISIDGMRELAEGEQVITLAWEDYYPEADFNLIP